MQETQHTQQTATRTEQNQDKKTTSVCRFQIHRCTLHVHNILEISIAIDVRRPKTLETRTKVKKRQLGKFGTN